MPEGLTLKSATVRSVSVPLRRPVVSKVGLFQEWPLILIDLYTNEGVVGRGYLEPYLKQSPRYIIPVIDDLVASQIGKRLAPLDSFQASRRSLNLVGYEGITMIAVVGIDMAIWDALAKAAGMPLAVMLGGSLGGVPAYNSNGLWLTDVSTLAKEAKELVAEGQFKGLKLRRPGPAGRRCCCAPRSSRGCGRRNQVDGGFQPRSIARRCAGALPRARQRGALLVRGANRLQQLVGLRQLARELQTPLQIGENFYGPRAIHDALAAGACDYVMPDLMRIGGVSGWLRAAPIAAAAGIQVSTHLYPEVAAHLMRVTETAHWLEWQDWADPILKEPFAVKNSCLEIPDLPGIGIEWDEAAVARYRH